MGNVFKKNSLREIKGSFSRWIAILLIVMLGVGFLSGLKVSKKAFIKTGQAFFDEQNFYDFQLISTWGITDEYISEIAKVEGVKQIEATYSADVIFSVKSNTPDQESMSSGISIGDKVAKLYALNDKINTVKLETGRLPEKDNECVVDYARFGESDLGSTIVISEDNDEDTLDMLKYKEYIIVGTVISPLYLNFERGSTSIGDGTVNCYIYTKKSAWDSEYYTELLLTMDEQGAIYSDEYKDNAEVMEDRLTDRFEELQEERYNEEIDSKIKEAEEELEEARIELQDGEDELNENEQKLRDAKIKLANKEKELEDAKVTIAEKEQELADATTELDGYFADYYEKRSQLETQKKQLVAAYGEEALSQVADSQKELNTYYAELKSKQADIHVYTNELNSKKAELTDGEKQIQDAKVELADAEKKLADGKKELVEAKIKFADAEEELDDAKNKADDYGLPKSYVLGRDTNIGYLCFDSDSSILNSIAKIFPIFFFLVAALVVMTTMTRMVDEQRTQIGVLKALGYQRRSILFRFVFYSATASLIGGIIGWIGGSFLFPWVIWSAYGIIYGFSDLIPAIDIGLGIIAILIAMICTVGTTILSCFSVMKEVPAELIRPKAPKAGKRVFLERIHFIWDRMPFLHKVSARNILRYKKRFFMMVLGICGCTALLITGFGISDSIKTVVSDQYDKILKVDYMVTFTDPVDKEFEESFVDDNSSIISDALYINASSLEIYDEDSVKSVNLIACRAGDDVSKFISLYDDNGPLDYPGLNEGILNESIADALNVKVGDKITCITPDKEELEVTITGLCKNYFYNYLYITSETYEEQIEPFEINQAYVIGIRNSDGAVKDPSGDGAKIMNLDNISSVQITNDFKIRFSNMLQALDYVVLLVLACAAALAFIVLYNLSNININERIREIATIKVLGFYDWETNSYVFRENLVLTFISAIVGMPLGAALHHFVMSQVKIDMVSFNIYVKPISYIFSVILTILFAVIVCFIMKKRIRDINMAESLKSIE